MQNWAEDLLQAINTAKNEDAIFREIEGAARHLGFEQCALGLRLPLPITQPKIVLRNNYLPAWQARYMEAGYLHVDPTVRHGRRTQVPLVWSNDVFAEVPEFWSEAQSQGLRVGWAQSAFDGYGVGVMLTLARSSDALTPAELTNNQFKMRWLVSIAHSACTRAFVPKVFDMPETPLTPRETEVLKWAADGKTSEQIGGILTISVDTVKFHMKNAVVKLKAANKTAAVARAAMTGMLN